ncbi:MAG TPA: serine/threonine-protein kinase, partial [Gemmatimonadaceae bacterium]|nr:serine/threonine-protein kinase [Gemmatimonadaceae bacterium]
MADTLASLQAVITGRYTIERELGRGGMATVYLARDLKHDRDVAVKVLNPDLAVALGAERFQREIVIATQLSHPHILPLYDSGEAGDFLYYVMPFVQGESLRARLDREHQLPVDDALRIAREVALALEHAHARGIVHRDIKPENILLEDGQAIVADFGIARAVSALNDRALTQTGVTLGTPTYMSPEQAMADRALDGRSDIYSLGCVLYEMLAGQPPFTGPTAHVVIARHTLEQVPSLAIVRGTIPEEVEEVVLTALAKVPADRFRSAGDFAQALQACIEGRRPTVGVMARRTVARRAPRRRPLGIIAAAVAGVLVLGGAGWWWARASGNAAPALAADPTSRKVAVLYFDDGSRDRRLGYLADGLTESLIEALESVPTLEVVSRNGVAPWR